MCVQDSIYSCLYYCNTVITRCVLVYRYFMTHSSLSCDRSINAFCLFHQYMRIYMLSHSYLTRKLAIIVVAYDQLARACMLINIQSFITGSCCCIIFRMIFKYYINTIPF